MYTCIYLEPSLQVLELVKVHCPCQTLCHGYKRVDTRVSSDVWKIVQMMEYLVNRIIHKSYNVQYKQQFRNISNSWKKYTHSISIQFYIYSFRFRSYWKDKTEPAASIGLIHLILITIYPLTESLPISHTWKWEAEVTQLLTTPLYLLGAKWGARSVIIIIQCSDQYR